MSRKRLPTWLYCILFLHQTTTMIRHQTTSTSCIASSFYIKPQLRLAKCCSRTRCIASSFYIKPQRELPLCFRGKGCIASSFYIKPQRGGSSQRRRRLLYCILFLHQTTTISSRTSSGTRLYCILFLHQTTTHQLSAQPYESCIASSFYIKPQRTFAADVLYAVVLHPLSTSNHNK